jgi:hypothetical protein
MKFLKMKITIKLMKILLSIIILILRLMQILLHQLTKKKMLLTFMVKIKKQINQ